MPLSRRRLVVLGLTLPVLGAWTPVAAQQQPDWLRGELDADPGSVFGLDPSVAAEVLLPATRDDALPDGYTPRDLVSAASSGIPANGRQLLRALIVDDTRAMVQEADALGHELYVGSGFRSQAYQLDVFAAQTARWGDEETANRYSARAGHSQHQLGTTLDFTSVFRAFRGSDTALWVSENAHRFGFVLPYTPASSPLTGYIDEPWHARWVGARLASQLQALGYQSWTDSTVDAAIARVRAAIG